MNIVSEPGFWKDVQDNCKNIPEHVFKALSTMSTTPPDGILGEYHILNNLYIAWFKIDNNLHVQCIINKS